MAKAVSEFQGLGEVASRFGEIGALQAEVKQHLSAIGELYARIAEAAGGIDGPTGRRPRGRPRKTAAAQKQESPKSSAKGPRKRAKRGALKEAVRQVLAGGKQLGCSEIVNALLKGGHQTASDPRIFYNTVYLSLKKDKGIEKTAEGYRLKAS